MRDREVHLAARELRRRLDGRLGRRQRRGEDAEVEIGDDGVDEVPGGGEGGLEHADPAGGLARHENDRGRPSGREERERDEEEEEEEKSFFEGNRGRGSPKPRPFMRASAIPAPSKKSEFGASVCDQWRVLAPARRIAHSDLLRNSPSSVLSSFPSALQQKSSLSSFFSGFHPKLVPTSKRARSFMPRRTLCCALWRSPMTGVARSVVKGSPSGFSTTTASSRRRRRERQRSRPPTRTSTSGTRGGPSRRGGRGRGRAPVPRARPCAARTARGASREGGRSPRTG